MRNQFIQKFAFNLFTESLMSLDILILVSIKLSQCQLQATLALYVKLVSIRTMSPEDLSSNRIISLLLLHLVFLFL